MFIAVSCSPHLKQMTEKPEECYRLQKTSYRIVNDSAVVQVAFTENVWYQDSIGITQLSAIRSIQYGSRDTIFPITVGYRFVDMRKKWAYEFRSLSDTAEIVQKWNKVDSITLTGGWNFFRKAFIQLDNLQTIGDTSINGIKFLRCRYVQSIDTRKVPGEALFRCDKKGTIFLLDVGVSNKVGCPLVKGTSFTPDGKMPTQSVEIQFLSNQFPDSVRRVFTAWKRNEMQHPVE